ncbi:MAG: LysM peptidoglycan-binding domain-containing M23 family metallopeptidase [Rhodospirillales bacterium]|nr:LysM peptidoglycan-binding domain-containing M23 family metallopeptidase [Rhodospirillales bacterium]
MRRSVICYLSSVVLLSACLSQKPAPVTLYGNSDGGGSAGVHSVVAGENLWSISQRYDIVMRDIVINNRLSAPFTLDPGQRLKLPPPRTYKVRAGDSLSTVSRLYSVSSSEVAKLNRLSPPYIIQPGQSLRLPAVTPKTMPQVMKTAQRGPSPNSSPQGEELKSVPVPSPKPSPEGRGLKMAKAVEYKPVRVATKPPKRSSSKFLKPVNGKIVSSYGPKKDGLHNDGVNIQAARGAAVKAADNGVVVYAGNEIKGSGNLILVRHDDRWMTAYAHLDRIDVKRGDVLKRGQAIGTVGSTGSVDSPQLHFEVRRGTDAINPSRYLEG